MEKIFIIGEDNSFVVHLTRNEHWKEGAVYPINKYDGSQGIEYGYQSDKDGSHLDTEKGATCLFEFAFCWRGVWEGRIYFKEEEYFSEDLVTIKTVWDMIEAILKDRIKKERPDLIYD